MKDRDDCPQPEPADHRFDSLARGFAKSRSRRSVLAGLGVALAGAIGLGRIPVAAEDDYIGEPVDLTKQPDDVYIGTPCGGNYCAEGEYCCNESCGICAPIGGGCTAQYCGGVTCGPTTCAYGEVCCNESCGICTPPDGVCSQEFCGETCGPTTCGYGEYCCNESCGICAPIGGGCIAQFCGEPCGNTTCGYGEYCCHSGYSSTSTCLPQDRLCAL